MAALVVGIVVAATAVAATVGALIVAAQAADAAEVAIRSTIIRIRPRSGERPGTTFLPKNTQT
jgi:hypothetical protein